MAFQAGFRPEGQARKSGLKGRPERSAGLRQPCRDLMVMEQLLQTLPSEIKVWVTERKPKTSTEAAEMADNYLRARKQQKDGRQQQERKPWTIAKGPREGGKRVEPSPKPTVSNGDSHRSTNGRRETPDGIQCYNCGKKGGTVLAMRCAAWNGRKWDLNAVVSSKEPRFEISC